jgi:hypothetical protein
MAGGKTRGVGSGGESDPLAVASEALRRMHWQ